MFEREVLTLDADAAPRLARLGDLLAEWEADATAANQARVQHRPRGVVTGLVGLDRALGGCLAPGLHVLHGAPGSGKTAFALQLAANCGCPALYLTTEMGALELLRRHTARVTGTYLGRLKSGELLPADSLALARRAVAAAPQLAIADATRCAAAPAWLRAGAEHVRGDAPHFLLVVDSVHAWAAALGEGAPEYEALNAALGELQRLAGQLGCAVLALGERNRAAMAGGGLHAAAGSRRFEYGGESVLALDRKADVLSDPSGEDAIMLSIEKNRNGAAGQKLPLRFHGALQQFREG